MPTTSANMGLIVPIASTGASGTGDVGPGYAQNISNDLLTTIDQHDHSFGKGVQITPAGLNISADLAFQGNNATQIRGARFTSQASALAGVGDVAEVYVKSGDLWFVNSSGTQVQVTAGSNLGTAPIGPTGPAGQSFVANYFQGGVTGATALNLPSNSNTLVWWNTSQVQGGNVTQPTGQGTGSSYIVIAQAGLYDVSYQMSFTGLTILAGAPAHPTVVQTINATGSLGGGTAIAASQCPLTVPVGAGNTGYPGSATARYVVQLAAGNNIETWVSMCQLGSAGAALYATGTSFTITKIG